MAIGIESILPAEVNGYDIDVAVDNLWLEIGKEYKTDFGTFYDARDFTFENPLDSEEWYNNEKTPDNIVELCCTTEYLHFFVKYVLNIDLLPYQCAILHMLWTKPLPILLATRGGGKSYLLAIYLILRACLNQGCKICVVGAALRQSMVLFGYLQTIWDNAPILRDICGKTNEPKRDQHACHWNCGASLVTFLPLGTGEKIRGQRANIIIADEFQSLPAPIFETVVRGFASVKSQAVHHNVVMAYKKKIMNHKGFNTAQTFEKLSNNYNKELRTYGAQLKNNQIILSGTASYEFNHFYRYYSFYRAIILTGGNKKEIKKRFPDMEILGDSIDASDYAIMRVPYNVIPPGMMDEKILSQGRATMDPMIFTQEYECCLDGQTPILTKLGIKNICDIEIGDEVLTHKGRFRKVIKLYKRPYKDQIVRLRGYGLGQDVLVTPNHPFWIDNEWISAEFLESKTERSHLKELNQKTVIDITDFISDYSIRGDMVAPKFSRQVLTDEEVELIENSLLSHKELSDQTGLKYQTIARVRNPRKTKQNKGYIPRHIDLNYDFGIILGYYAAEGCVGANGRATSFSLDGHYDVSLQTFVNELKDAINRVFSITPKVYNRYNVSNVTVNSVLVSQLLKSICPGVCYDKYIDPNILFSNKEFLKGFIRGFWNGDGHNRKEFAVATTTSKALMGQLAIALSYFDIGFSFSEKTDNIYKFRGEVPQKGANAFTIRMNGKNHQKFISEFFDIDDSKDRAEHYIKSSNDKTIFKIKAAHLEDYDNFVYNLEVEEDHSYSLPNATVHNCFSSDSNGFYLASTLNTCTCPIQYMGTDAELIFGPRIYGDTSKAYVLAIDPASEDDNFAIMIMELQEDGTRRVVYLWTTNREDFESEKRANKIAEGIHDYNTFCIKHIRDLCRRFNVVKIICDSGGGGISVKEGLRDPAKLIDASDYLIYDAEDPYVANEKGRHILHLMEFSNKEWYRTSHYALRADLLNKKVLFPSYDIADAATDSYYHEELLGLNVWDRKEDVYVEIEQCKQETALIKHNMTPGGSERWDVPKVVGLDADMMKKQLKKDRFTALLLSNWGCRMIQEDASKPKLSDFSGGTAKTISSNNARGGKIVRTGVQEINQPGRRGRIYY